MCSDVGTNDEKVLVTPEALKRVSNVCVDRDVLRAPVHRIKGKECSYIRRSSPVQKRRWKTMMSKVDQVLINRRAVRQNAIYPGFGTLIELGTKSVPIWNVEP